MTVSPRMRAVPLLAITVWIGAVAVVAQELPSLAVAQRLYASAEYTRALETLERLRDAGPSLADRPVIDLYRALCLIATGQPAEATDVLQALVTEHPFYQPGDELPPRVREHFDEIRRTVLRSLAEAQYLDAKRAYDAADHAAAVTGFSRTLALLGDSGVGILDPVSPIAHLAMLAEGFRELSTRALEPPHPDPRVYSVRDAGVVAPMTVAQTVPPYPGPVRDAREGTLELLIDERGAVESVRLLQSVAEDYDQLVLDATKDWRYEPATVGGVPVAFVKRVRITLLPKQ